MTVEIFQLVYKSQYNSSRVDNNLKMLREIIEKSRYNNTACNVTGYLIFDGNVFVQILEGNISDVKETYNRIGKDQRHRQSFVIAERNVTKRDFSGWAMGGILQTEPVPTGINAEEAIELAKKLSRLQETSRP